MGEEDDTFMPVSYGSDRMLRRMEDTKTDFTELRDFLDSRIDSVPQEVIDRTKSFIKENRDKFDSEIEVLALAKIMCSNLAPHRFGTSYPSGGRLSDCEAIISITPQFQLGRRRADFLIESRFGFSFILECDGKDFHDALTDAKRDVEIESEFGLKTLRLTGSEIWRSSDWIFYVQRWCVGNFVEKEQPFI